MQEAPLFQIDVVSLLIKRNFLVFVFLGSGKNSSFSGIRANVAKQAIVYAEFNCQTGETAH